ncbi:MAG: GntR family transcriptional regulator [Hyphomicrobiales bacterium]|nr:GntR family transcriptional regulator [Hyphomicrobiales bacterium]
MPQSAAEKVRSKLEHDILTFVIKPGEKLDETRLAEVNGVSRTPVREALRQLAASGLVDMRPHRGAVARRLSLGEIVELFELMSMLEGLCVRLAAKRAMIQQLAAIRAAHEHCRTHIESESLDAYYKANEQFHETIYHASGNAALIKQTIQLRDRLKPFRRYQLNRINRVQESFAEHDRIVAAIENGAAAAAEELIQDHLAVQGTFITNIVNSMPREFLDKRESEEILRSRSSIAARDEKLYADLRYAK